MLSVLQVQEHSVKAPWTIPTSTSGLISKSTWSLGLIAHWFKSVNSASTHEILLPDFFCDSALTVVRELGFKPLFYPTDMDGAANVAKLRELCLTHQPALLVMVHYFGVANSQSSAFREIAKVHGLWLIEDCVHCALPTSKIGSVGDFAIFSPHKLLPIPLGAVLTVRSNGPTELSASAIKQFGDPKSWAQQIHLAVSPFAFKITSAHRFEIIWVLKRLAQRLGFGRKIRIGTNSSTNIKKPINSLVEPKVSEFSKRLLNVLVTTSNQRQNRKFKLPIIKTANMLEDIAAVRQYNACAWHRVITALGGKTIQPIQFDVLKNIPYLASYSGDEKTIFKIVTKLRQLGVPVSTWPDLPKEVRKYASIHQGAITLEKTRLYLPVHHNIREQDIQKLIKKLCGQESLTHQSVVVRKEFSPIRWREHLTKIEFSNMLQAWEYGDAKAKSEKWTIQRNVYSTCETDVAVAQYLNRRVLGLIKISRLSRGPLFFNTATCTQIASVLNKVTKEHSWTRFQILSISPEIYISSKINCAGMTARLRRVSTVGTQSSILHLDQTLPILRKNLDPKWRNQLKVSELSDAKMIHSTKYNDFLWFESVYDSLQLEKKFQGIPANLFRSTWREFFSTNNAHLFIGLRDEAFIAAILIITHGNSATYLAGWNSPDGRKLNVNNLLLWEASSHLKQWGITKFDLGGVDEKQTPTISKFKVGMGGQTYKTIGEFIKI
jgi:dTDP-4-amino-4,6-dideoxygalactose transaminase